MQKRKSFLPVFVILFCLSVLLFLLSRAGILYGLTGFFESATAPIQRAVFGIAQAGDSESEIARLKEENSKLAARLVKQTETEREIKALRGQFQISNPTSSDLLLARVIGIEKDSLTLDKGQADGVKTGKVVVLNDNLVGQIDKASEHISSVKIITNDDSSFTAKTLKSGSLGIIKGQGSNLLFDNVILTDKLEKDDLVTTKGDVDDRGIGFPPDLVVGKIVTINKKESDLFQSAEVRSLVDFGRLETVFVISTNN